MKNLKEFNIQFVGLREGTHQYEYQIDNKFFDAFNFDEFNNSNINVIVILDKKSTLLELNLQAEGIVNVPCDKTGVLFDLEIEGNFPLIVKFGQEFNNDSEEVLIITHGEYEINVAHYIYELIVLSVPSKRIHPKVIDGTMESKALERLKELEYTEKENTVEENSADPRWDKLKDLLTGKKE